MSLWVQHGYGKGDKIDRLVANGQVGGVILSPADEERSALRATAQGVIASGVSCVLDPQTYIYSIPGGTARCHASHGLDFGELQWAMAPSEVEETVRAVLSANEELGLPVPIGPTCLQRSFADIWTPLSVQFARTTLGLAGNDVYVSLAVEDAGLSDWNAVEAWLDTITALDPRGFYVVAARGQDSYPKLWDAGQLGHLLRLVYRLTELNEFEVIVGFADLDGLLLLAAGALGIGSGWFYSLRVFSETKWQPTTGGRQARPRVTSATLMTPLLAQGEASEISRSRLAARVFPEERLVELLARAPESWSLTDASSQHLAALGGLAQEIDQSGPLPHRVTELQGRLGVARTLLAALRDEGIVLSPSYDTRLATLETALSTFALEEGLFGS